MMDGWQELDEFEDTMYTPIQIQHTYYKENDGDFNAKVQEMVPDIPLLDEVNKRFGELNDLLLYNNNLDHEAVSELTDEIQMGNLQEKWFDKQKRLYGTVVCDEVCASPASPRHQSKPKGDSPKAF